MRSGRLLAKALGLDEERVRVVVPDVGGGFGAKFLAYPEEVVLACATRMLGRPLKWIEDRREHFLSAIQARTQFWQAKWPSTPQARSARSAVG